MSPVSSTRRIGVRLSTGRNGLRGCIAPLIVGLLLSGCGVAQVAVEASREGAKDIRVTTSRHYDQAKLVDTQTVGVFVRSVGEKSAIGFSGFSFGATGGSASEVIQSRISALLIQRGLDVLDAGDIERLATDEEADKPTERIIIRLAQKAGAQLVVLGIAESGSVMKFGLFGVGAGSESGIVSATVKFVDAETGRPVAMLSADYKEPKSANEVIDQIAPFIGRIMKGEARNIQEKQKSLL